MPSAPSISEVKPFSTTAQIQFEEPESVGGVPVLKYRAEWRTQGRGSWVNRVYEVQDGENTRQIQKDGIVLVKLPVMNAEHLNTDHCMRHFDRTCIYLLVSPDVDWLS